MTQSKRSDAYSKTLRGTLFFYIAIIILWPNFILSSSDELRQVMTMLLIIFSLLSLVTQSPTKIQGAFHLTSEFRIIFVLLLVYTTYIFLNIFLNQVLSGEAVFRDFAEIARVLGLMSFFLLGSSIKKEIDSRQAIHFSLLLSAIYSFIVISFLFAKPLFEYSIGILYSFREHRLSGTMPNSNYVWNVVVLMVFAVLAIQSKKLLFLKVFTFLLSALFLFLSGSRTSIATLVFCIIAYFFVALLSSRRMKNTKEILLIALILPLFLIMIYNIVMESSFVSPLLKSRMATIPQILKGDISDVSSYQKRIAHWEFVRMFVEERPLFGHGSAKSEITITDNSYLMSLYRYGICGLSIELLILGFFLTLTAKKCFSGYSFSVYVLPLIFSAANLFSSFFANNMYELKLPYIQFLLIGYFSSNFTSTNLIRVDIA